MARVFVIERFVPALTPADVESQVVQERAMVSLATEMGSWLRHLRTTYLHTDELCFSVYEAASLDLLRQVNERANLPYERITEATEIASEAVS